MRLGGSTVMLALLLGVVPALAQESPGLIPAPAQPTEKAKPGIAVPRRRSLHQGLLLR
jgi:hypothetical protein